MDLRKLSNEELLESFEEMRKGKDLEISLNFEFAQSIDEIYLEVETEYYNEFKKRNMNSDFLEEIPY